ncbi:MAG: hypothetical protein COB30_009625 [Ectothiorhodospiraceae bacterium]|nr:hypothetical protein [Ectothiorhodospiraceae bacterium]
MASPKPETSPRITDKSAAKVVEILLHTMRNNLSQPLDALNAKKQLLAPEQQYSLGEINDTVERMELIMSRALRTEAVHSAEELDVLSGEVIEGVRADLALQALATSTTVADSDEFYRFCVKALAELYGSRYALISLILPERNRVRTLAVWAGDSHGENIEYDLAGTPCEDVVCLKKALIPTNVQALYPRDELLTQMEADSYYGAPLMTKDQGTIGLVAVLDTKPMQHNEWTAPVLGVFAARIAVEALRQNALKKLTTLNAELESRVQQRTQEMEARNQELKAFSYSVSHDLRAPVRTIVSFIDIVFEDYRKELPEGAVEDLGRVRRAGTHLNELIDAMLVLSRITAQGLVMKKLDLSALANECINKLREHHGERHVDIRIAPGLSGWGDEKLLLSALQNLLSNAWKYTRDQDRARIDVGQKKHNGKQAFFIGDNGAGFDMTQSDRLFKPFQRLHSEQEFEGTGVGLATVKRIIARHGGEVWAEGATGEGATFYFTLGESKPIRPE